MSEGRSGGESLLSFERLADWLAERAADPSLPPRFDLRLWHAGTAAAPAAGTRLLLPFDRQGRPVEDLAALIGEPLLGSGCRLVLSARQAAGLDLGQAADRVVVAGTGDAAWQALCRNHPLDHPLLTAVFALLAHCLSSVGSPSGGRVGFDPAAWGLRDLKPALLEAVDQRLLFLSARGLRFHCFDSLGLACLRPYAVPPPTGAEASLPTISIVMPVYNAERYLGEALASIRSQSVSDFELICVNDGSSDGSAAILAAAAARDPRIRVIEQPNRGVSVARNSGMEAARGDFLCFADADDIMLPDSLARRLALLAESGEVLCGGRAVFVDETGRDLGMAFGQSARVWFAGSYAMPFHLTTLMGQRPLMKRAQFPEGIAHAEDWAYLVEILRDGWSAASCGEAPLVAYRWHGGSATNAHRDRHLEGCLRFLDRLAQAPAQPRLVLPRPERALLLSRRRLELAKVRRLQAHFVTLLLAGEQAAAARLAREPGLGRAPARPKWLDRDFFDVASVRVFREPRGSAALQRAVGARLEEVFDGCARLPAGLANAYFALLLRRYVLDAACASGAGRQSGKRLRLAVEGALVAVRLVLFRIGRLLTRLTTIRHRPV